MNHGAYAIYVDNMAFFRKKIAPKDTDFRSLKMDKPFIFINSAISADGKLSTKERDRKSVV